ncbi:MAG: putative bifunctional diguanylate cyclase/phosphodiesterase, partial [Janthinobacterium lividum]
QETRRLAYRRYGVLLGLTMVFQALVMAWLWPLQTGSARSAMACLLAAFAATVVVSALGWRMVHRSIHVVRPLDSDERRAMQISAALRFALERNELTPVYQPKVSMADGALCGFEVLLRWNSADHGDIAPAEFIPWAETSGMVVAIGLWTLEQACRQLADWQRRFPHARGLRLAVNVSMRQLLQASFLFDVEAILARTGIAPASIELELTETAAMADPERSIDTLGRLKGLGLRLALDDFGTGHSSLAWLQKLPIDVIKIDKSFLPGLDGERGDGDIIRLLLALAQALGLDTVAEGIESFEQLAALRALGCKIGQGYIFSHALSASDAETLLKWPTPFSLH